MSYKDVNFTAVLSCRHSSRRDRSLYRSGDDPVGNVDEDPLLGDTTTPKHGG